MQDNLKRFIRDTGWALASLAIAAAVQFILRIFLARYYGAADLGLYSLAFSAYSFGLVFSGFGIDSGLVKYVAERKENARYVNILVTSGSAISLFTGFIMGLILFLVSPYISTYFFKLPELTVLFQIVSLSFPFIALEKTALGFLNGVRRMKVFAFINIVQNILVIILTLTFALRGLDIKYAVLGLVLPLVFMSVISIFYIRKSLSRLQIVECAPVVKMLLEFGLYVVLANSMGTVLAYTDSILLGHFMTDVDVGYYAVAAILIQAVALPPLAIQRITGPMIAGYWWKNEIRHIEALVNRSMKYTAFYAILIAFIIGFLSQDVIKVFFSSEFLPAAFPVQILMIGAVFGAIQTSIGSALSSTAYVKIIFKLTGIAVLLNIALNVLLIPPFGINGAAIATSSTTAISAFIQLFFIQRLIKIKIDGIWFVKLFCFVILIAAGTYGIGKIFSLYASVILALIILTIVMLKYFVTSEERNQIKKLFVFQL